jgi:hypothetical protein
MRDTGFVATDNSRPEFEDLLKEVGSRARAEAFAAGQPVIYRDQCGCYVQEFPDGRKFEIRFRPGASSESHIERVREFQLAV